MWSSYLFWKLFLVYVALNLILAVAFLVVVTSSQRTEVNRHVEQRLLDTAIVLRSHVGSLLAVALSESADSNLRDEARGELQALVKRLAAETKTRLTVVSADGMVLADSERDPESMLNHANRPEIIDAIKTGKGTATRQSPTLQVDLHYVALAVQNDGNRTATVRVAMRVDAINERVAAVRRFLWMFAFIFGAAAAGLTYLIVGRITQPLAQLTERAQAIAAGLDENPVPVESADEVGRLADSFNQMQSELTRRFRQLRDSNEQMATVLGTVDEGILAVSADQNIILANDACKTLFDLPQDNMDRPLVEVVRSRRLQEVVQDCLSTGGPIQTEFSTSSHMRRECAVRVTCLPGNPPPGVVVVLHDISELRRLENLRQDFVANVSHELKTPLASIKAYAETLRLGAVNDAENNMHFVGRIEEQAERLHRLILDMLQIARVESGEEAFEITLVSIDQVVDACIAHYAPTAERDQIQLVVEAPTDIVLARADEDGLRTILDNLVSNALKYTGQNGQVTVRWRANGQNAELEVQDTGIGIDEKHQTRIFERFYRVDKARSRELGGTGLGLSIVKHLAQAFGGSVELTSQPGKGSVFRVFLPLS